jgi:hypothetical protein
MGNVNVRINIGADINGIDVTGIDVDGVDIDTEPTESDPVFVGVYEWPPNDATNNATYRDDLADIPLSEWRYAVRYSNTLRGYFSSQEGYFLASEIDVSEVVADRYGEQIARWRVSEVGGERRNAWLDARHATHGDALSHDPALHA